MEIRECILDNKECDNIVIKAVDIEYSLKVRENGKWLVNVIDLLDKKVKTSTRIGNDLIEIQFYFNR